VLGTAKPEAGVQRQLALESPMTSPATPAHQPTVLLVEDDELLRDAVTRVLAREGYLVLTAPTAHDAIGLLKTPSTPVDVIMLDIGLPDVSGADLCARVRELFPKLPVVVCTGAAGPEEVAELKRLGINRIYAKPVAVEELVAGLRAAAASADGA
jgi:DNA-binding response OmpR family regulator